MLHPLTNRHASASVERTTACGCIADLYVHAQPRLRSSTDCANAPPTEAGQDNLPAAATANRCCST